MRELDAFCSVQNLLILCEFSFTIHVILIWVNYILLMGEESLCIKEEKSLHADDNQEDLGSHPI